MTPSAAIKDGTQSIFLGVIHASLPPRGAGAFSICENPSGDPATEFGDVGSVTDGERIFDIALR